MPNIKKNISRHNNKLLQAEIKQQNPALFPPDPCNCQARYKPDCPIPGKCNANNVIYRAHVTWQNNNIGETYTGVTKNFKTRYGAHKGSFTKKNLQWNSKAEPSAICQYVCQSFLFVQPIKS